MTKKTLLKIVKVSSPNDTSLGDTPSLSHFHVLRFTLHAALLFITLALTSCITLPDTEVAQTQAHHTIGHVTPSQSVGQSFRSRRPNLNGVTLWLAPVDDVPRQINVTLRESPTSPVVASSTIEVSQHGSIQVDFPLQADSADRDYYLELSTQAGDVEVLGRDEDAYPEGVARVDAIPTQGDIAFRLTYSYTLGTFGADLLKIAADLWMIFPLGLILLLPGYLILTWAFPSGKFDFGEKIALSLALSLALIPLVMLWTSTVGIVWTQTGVAIAGGLLIFAGGIHFLKHPPSFKLPLLTSSLQTPNSNFQYPTLALIGIFILSLTLRLIMVRDLAAPAWVDSVHHSLITRYIIQAGGFPDSYAPHFPPDANYYHIGYHSILATFYWLTNLDLPRAMLILGQVLNALTIFAVYTFTTTLTGKKNAALIAALITGVFTPMPAYYASWGRYTQLTGLLILPAGLVWAKLARETSSPGGRVRVIFLSTLAFSGLFLTHYRTAAFLGSLLLVYALVEILFPRLGNGESRLTVLKKFAFIFIPAGVLAAVLTSPWLIPTLSRLILPKSQAWSGETKTLFADFVPRYLTAKLGTSTLILAGSGLILAFLRKKRFALTLSIWILILFGLANIGVLGLPGQGFINNTSVEITLFIPISLLGGFLIQEIVDFVFAKLQGRWKKAARWGCGFLLVGAIAFGIPRVLTVLNPNTVFFHAADREAIAWIGENIPPDEIIALNPTGWGYGLSRGEDGGYWISPLTGNPTMPPPVLYGLEAETMLYVNQFVTAVQTTAQNPRELAQVLTGYGVKYIYLGRHGGILSPMLLKESERFKCLYENEGAWVFEVAGVP